MKPTNSPTPYSSPPAPNPALEPLSDSDRTLARDIWAQLMAGNSEPFEGAPENIRAHIFEASRVSLQNGDEPDMSNPFDQAETPDVSALNPACLPLSLP